MQPEQNSSASTRVATLWTMRQPPQADVVDIEKNVHAAAMSRRDDSMRVI